MSSPLSFQINITQIVAVLVTFTGVVLWSANVNSKAELALHENAQTRTEITEIKAELKEQGKALSGLQVDIKTVLHLVRLRSPSLPSAP
tara:strand:+ start:4664 stop:4930 length:267 start_codon:yes stop_codon:yes gene_type:complete